jgi:hypothetical protein
MNSILEFGINASRSELIADFGPGFYCTDSTNVRTAVHFAVMTAFENPDPGTQSCSVIYCDCKNEDLATLNQITAEGENWTRITKLCLSGNDEKAFSGDVELVKGKLVHNPNEVHYKEHSPQAYDDDRKQFALKKRRRKLAVQG